MQSNISHHPWEPSFQPHERVCACDGGESPHFSHDAVLGEEDFDSEPVGLQNTYAGLSESGDYGL